MPRDDFRQGRFRAEAFPFKEFGQTRRAILRAVLDRAAARGELRAGLDPDLAIDILVGPIFTRRLITRAPLTRKHAEAVLDLLLPVLQQP